jgi:hypothetical protein
MQDTQDRIRLQDASRGTLVPGASPMGGASGIQNALTRDASLSSQCELIQAPPAYVRLLHTASASDAADSSRLAQRHAERLQALAALVSRPGMRPTEASLAVSCIW